MRYLIVADNRGEQVFFTGAPGRVEALARRLNAGGFFRYVRVAADPRLHAPRSGGAPPRRDVMDRARGPRRVLIADSYADAADSLAILVSLWGHETAVARDGPEALELARAWRPDVALLELKLAGLDGYALGRRLRAQAGRGLVLAALTGYSDEAHRRPCGEAGFDHYLVKPVEPDALRALLAAGRV